jgi:hypothetical protein
MVTVISLYINRKVIQKKRKLGISSTATISDNRGYYLLAMEVILLDIYNISKG